jgi:hypothetical protein
MGRFDGLKENTFSSKKTDRVHTRDRPPKVKKTVKEEFNKKKVVNVKEKPIVNVKEKPIVKEEEPVIKEESEWIKRIKKNEEKKKEKIDVNDPIYWNGPNWKGPIFLKQEKMKNKWNNDNIKLLNEGKVSTVILPCNKIKYSRDDENWYNSYNETFTIKQLNAIREYELQRSYDQLSDRLVALHNQRRNESYLNYEMSGEIDSFMWAEIEHEKYEKYYDKLEKEWEEIDKKEKEEEEELDSDLEYD